MTKRFVSVALTISILSLALAAPGSGAAKGKRGADFAEKVKAAVATLGLGPEARVEVRSGNGAKTKGYISEVHDSEFVVVDEKTGLKTNVAYSQVKAISGKNSATGAKFALSRGGGAATPLILAAACIGGVILAVSLLLKGS